MSGQAGQTSGSTFEVLLAQFLRDTFPRLQHVRPGEWDVIQLGNRSAMKTSSFAQYEHLEYLHELTSENARLKTILGNDYMVAPDVVVYRHPMSDEALNAPFDVVDEQVSTLTELRSANNERPLLLASVSAKMDHALRPGSEQPNRGAQPDSESQGPGAAYRRRHGRAAPIAHRLSRARHR